MVCDGKLQTEQINISAIFQGISLQSKEKKYEYSS